MPAAIIFDPIPRVDGIEPSEDPLLNTRADVYLLSGRRRRAAAIWQQKCTMQARKGLVMRESIAKNWWVLVLRGLLGIGFGVIAFVWPGITLASLVILFAAYALVDGVMAMVAAVRALESHNRWGSLLIEGIAGIAAGVITMAWPAITAIWLIYLIAAWAIVTGIFEIFAAVRLRRHIAGEWLLALTGIASLIFGVLIMIAPLAGALVIAIWIGAYAFIFGVLLIALGLRLRNWAHGHHGPSVIVPAL